MEPTKPSSRGGIIKSTNIDGNARSLHCDISTVYDLARALLPNPFSYLIVI